ncbi:MAG TPA: hypothetical protein VH063_01525 [Gaiellaceae bacterium]|jgi:hypothetical protein|nr:hypothetical protein [Gaiellaceae bacterium]
MRFLVALMVIAAAGVAIPGATTAPVAASDTCGVPSVPPVWVDFGGHDAPIPAKPGVTIAVASGTDVPMQMRQAGAATVLFDLNFNKRVGTTSNPADPSLIDARAKSFYDYAVTVTGCQTPTIAENELAGAQTPTPWTPNNAQYRANVLQFLTDLTNLGATPLLSIANPPYTGGDAGYWWQQVSKVAILLRQVYFTSPNLAALYKRGPSAASVSMRQSLRGLVDHLTQIGIPSGRVALEMQLTTSPGLGQRAGLLPEPWFEMVKLEGLAAKFVATQFKLQGVWSWGWATFSTTAAPDPDKAAAACVWLWTRDQSLCDGPTAAGAGFDASLTEGQLDVPAGDRCLTSAGAISRNAVARFTTLTGDPGYAASALLEELTLASQEKVAYPDLLSAERAVIVAEFGGDRAKYFAAVKAAKLTLGDARTIIAARLEQDDVEAQFKAPAPSKATVADFLATYQDEDARLVSATAPAPWLGGQRTGWAIESLAPAEVFTLAAPGKIDTADGTFEVTPSGSAMPLGLLPPAEGAAAARQALDRLTRETIYRTWLRTHEQALLASASCLNDQVPTAEETDLSSFVPFLFPAA